MAAVFITLFSILFLLLIFSPFFYFFLLLFSYFEGGGFKKAPVTPPHWMHRYGISGLRSGSVYRKSKP